MQQRSLVRGSIIFLGLLLIGAGCGKPSAVTTQTTATASSTAAAVGSTQLARQIRFTDGDSFEIAEQFPGSGVYDAKLQRSTSGTRWVTVTQFTPLKSVDIRWSAAAIGLPLHSGKDQPAQVISASGTIAALDLNATHKLLLPAFWTPTAATAVREKSGLWLSDETFQDLKDTGMGSVALGLLDQANVDLFKKDRQAQAELRRFQRLAKLVELHHDDIDLARAATTTVDVPLTVNGTVVHVAAIKVHVVFGDLYVLNNRQNPLIIKIVLSSNLEKRNSAASDIFGYEVNNLIVSQFQAAP